MIRRIWVAQLICPLCDREHFYESETQIDQCAPDKLGMGALCGSCEAMRRCWYVGHGSIAPFWTEAVEARAWVNIRHYPDRYQMQTWETEPHDQPLRDDQLDKLLQLIGVRSKKGYAPRYKFRWTDDEMHARGIDWPLPPQTTPKF